MICLDTHAHTDKFFDAIFLKCGRQHTTTCVLGVTASPCLRRVHPQSHSSRRHTTSTSPALPQLFPCNPTIDLNSTVLILSLCFAPHIVRTSRRVVAQSLRLSSTPVSPHHILLPLAHTLCTFNFLDCFFRQNTPLNALIIF